MKEQASSPLFRGWGHLCQDELLQEAQMGLDQTWATYSRGPHTLAMHVPEWAGDRVIWLLLNSKLQPSQESQLTLNFLLK